MIFRILIIILFIILLWLVFKCYRILKKIYWLIIKKNIINFCLKHFKKDHHKKCRDEKCKNEKDSLRDFLRDYNIELTDAELDILMETL